jgi:DNA polymerase-3 subunit alpha
MAALLTSEMSNTDKIVQYLGEAREMEIEILPPDINSSDVDFVGCGANRVRFGLAAIKNVGESAIRSIIQRRVEDGPFKGFFDFCERTDSRLINRRVVESLIKAGALDSLHPKRKSLYGVLDRALEHGQKVQRDLLSGQQGLFGGESATPESASDEIIPDEGEWHDREKWGFEKETLGFYLSGHPLQKYQVELKSFSRLSSSEINEEVGGQDISIGGVVAGVRNLRTRKGDSMAIFQLEDMSGVVDVLLWPNTYEKYRRFLDSEFPILVRGRCDVDARGEVKVLCEEILDLSSVWKEGVHRATIRIPVPTIHEACLSSFETVVRHYPGNCQLEFELVQGNEYAVHVVPSKPLRINPIPAFVREVEALFGENSCILEIPR